jgi:hypothetical protein
MIFVCSQFVQMITGQGFFHKKKYPELEISRLGPTFFSYFYQSTKKSCFFCCCVAFYGLISNAAERERGKIVLKGFLVLIYPLQLLDFSFKLSVLYL